MPVEIRDTKNLTVTEWHNGKQVTRKMTKAEQHEVAEDQHWARVAIEAKATGIVLTTICTACKKVMRLPPPFNPRYGYECETCEAQVDEDDANG